MLVSLMANLLLVSLMANLLLKPAWRSRLSSGCRPNLGSIPDGFHAKMQFERGQHISVTCACLGHGIPCSSQPQMCKGLTLSLFTSLRTACLKLLSWCRGVEGASLSELELYKEWAKRHMSAMIARLQKSERERREETQRVRAAASQLIKVLQLLMAPVCC